MKIIESILDTDLYKLTMQNAVLCLYREAQAKIQFINRKPKFQVFNQEAITAINSAIEEMAELRLTSDEFDFLSQRCSYLNNFGYLYYLKNYRFNPKEVKVDLQNGNLSVEITGPWHSAILWEVPLMAIISEVYFRIIHKNWSMKNQAVYAEQKQKEMCAAGCQNADFGTRRRRSYDTQSLVVACMKKFDSFVGTSNVHLAMQHGVTPIGTMAHEWIQAHSVLCSLRHANRYALQSWNDVYQGLLGIALTDTYGSESFWMDFDRNLSRLYDGVRHDSGNPYRFVDAAVKHYRRHKIDPMTKTAVFSDGLNVQNAIEIHKYCRGKIKDSYGIGTHYTNDFPDGMALNMVIKLVELDNIPVIKLSDEPGKMSGDKDAIRVANYIHRGIPLDQEA